MSTGDVLLFLILGTVITALPDFLFARAIGSLGAHTASLVGALEPLYALLLSWIILGATFGVRELFGALLLVLAVVWGTYTKELPALNTSVRIE